jgi:outer membrane protein assembly factor BamB
MFRPLALALSCLLSLWCRPACGDDWPQWLGLKRDSTWREAGTLTRFPSAGAKILWRARVAGGYSGPAVAAGRVFVTDYLREEGEAANDPNARAKLSGRERVLCFDAASGRQLWRHDYECPYSISYPSGPRATPAIDAGRVYSLGAEGNLVCLNASDGRIIWQRDLKHDFKAPTPIWGFCSHPLVDGDTLFLLCGGPDSIVIALDKRTGKGIWHALSAPDAGYSPPMLIEAGGRRQLIAWDPQTVNGLDPATGQLFWSVKLEPDFGMSIVAPRKSGEYLFAGGIKNKGVCLRLDAHKPAVEELWRSSKDRGVGPVDSPVVPVGDVMYAVDREGELTAVDLPSGRRLWQTFAATTGDRRANSASAFMVLNGDHFYIMNDQGELIVARLSPEGYTELDRAKILEPTNEAFGRRVVWSHPAFSGRRMFARNDKELVCVSLEAE